MADQKQGKSQELIDRAGFWQRVTKVLKSKTAPEIARKLGIKKQSVYEWQKGNLPALPMLVAIAKFPESGIVSLHWLLTGQGSRYIQNVEVFRTAEEIQKAEEFESYFDKDTWAEIDQAFDNDDQWSKAKLWFTHWVEDYLSKELIEELHKVAKLHKADFPSMLRHCVVLGLTSLSSEIKNERGFISLVSFPDELKAAVNKYAQVRKVNAATIVQWAVKNGLDVLTGKLIVVARENADRIKEVNELSREEWKMVLDIVKGRELPPVQEVDTYVTVDTALPPTDEELGKTFRELVTRITQK